MSGFGLSLQPLRTNGSDAWTYSKSVVGPLNLLLSFTSPPAKLDQERFWARGHVRVALPINRGSWGLLQGRFPGSQSVGGARSEVGQFGSLLRRRLSQRVLARRELTQCMRIEFDPGLGPQPAFGARVESRPIGHWGWDQSSIGLSRARRRKQRNDLRDASRAA